MKHFILFLTVTLLSCSNLPALDAKPENPFRHLVVSPVEPTTLIGRVHKMFFGETVQVDAIKIHATMSKLRQQYDNERLNISKTPTCLFIDEILRICAKNLYATIGEVRSYARNQRNQQLGDSEHYLPITAAHMPQILELGHAKHLVDKHEPEVRQLSELQRQLGEFEGLCTKKSVAMRHYINYYHATCERYDIEPLFHMPTRIKSICNCLPVTHDELLTTEASNSKIIHAAIGTYILEKY